MGRVLTGKLFCMGTGLFAPVLTEYGQVKTSENVLSPNPDIFKLGMHLIKANYRKN